MEKKYKSPTAQQSNSPIAWKKIIKLTISLCLYTVIHSVSACDGDVSGVSVGDVGDAALDSSSSSSSPGLPQPCPQCLQPFMPGDNLIPICPLCGSLYDE
jgi:hypothetical protein